VAHLEPYAEFLPTLCGASSVTLVPASAETVDGMVDIGAGSISVRAAHADGTKCERCWRFVPAVSDEAGTEGLCPRCVEALAPAEVR
jgi:isoleucyl-tRNA synthetase